MVNYGTSTFQPWQFSVDASKYGAKGDGVVCTLTTVNGNTTVTASTPVFTSTGADGGKYVMIHGAQGSTAGPLVTTIASVTDTTHAVLAAAPTASVTACPAVFGTDDTAAINAALAAAGAYATAHSYFAEVVFGAKTYILGTGPTQTSSPTVQNSQLVLPFPDRTGITQKMIIALTGAGDAGYCQYWESLVPNVAGTALVSMLAPTTTTINNNLATFGRQSVIGGPSGGGGFTGGYSNVKAVIKGIGIWCGIYTNLYACDLGYASAQRAQQSGAHIFAPTGVNGAAVPPYLNSINAGAFTGSLGCGWRTPVTGNNDDVVFDDVVAEGYECAFRVFDHFTGGRLAAIYSDVALLVDGTLGVAATGHAVTITQFSAEVYNGGISSSGSVQLDVVLDSENASVIYDISDSGNNLRGLVKFRDPADPSRGVTVSGAANLRVIDEGVARGHMASPPAVPASGSAATLVWRDAWVVIHTGAGVTVSVVTIAGTATGLTMAASGQLAVRVASGETIALTYAGGTPTWDWWLE